MFGSGANASFGFGGNNTTSATPAWGQAANNQFTINPATEWLGDGKGTSVHAFKPIASRETQATYGSVFFQSIMLQPEYKKFNHEELRMQDYLHGRLFGENPEANKILPNTGTRAYPYVETRDKDPITYTSIQYQSITFMPQYKGNSFEELRMEDYRQGLVFASDTHSPGSASSSFGSSAFGNLSRPSGFGSTPAFATASAAPSAFGTNTAASSGFGAKPSTGFGATSAPATEFGTQAASGFGSSTFGATSAPAFGGFGASTASPFGSNAAQNKPAFGFGTSQPQSGFGAASNSGAGFGFGVQSAFGKPASTGFGVSATSGFGATGTSGFGNPSSSGFGNSTATGFGNANPTGVGAGGFGANAAAGFGKTAPTGFGTGGFGGQAAAPTGFGINTATGFGNNTATGFGNTGFGGQAAAPFSANQSSGLGSNPSLGTGFMTSQPTNSFAGFGQTSSSFSGLTNLQANTLTPAKPSAASLNPYGDILLFEEILKENPELLAPKVEAPISPPVEEKKKNLVEEEENPFDIDVSQFFEQPMKFDIPFGEPAHPHVPYELQYPTPGATSNPVLNTALFSTPLPRGRISLSSTNINQSFYNNPAPASSSASQSDTKSKP
ncbi:hypothetical protein DSO57_1001109 [Entomophthora muscae]|uniref:Uncharacterized protein n=1 Tax=Entomophthora muscae TaxID=34485 RepID=A0ACC2SB57_9FUNG|nr:hypothetical protein DSO57_1001109 [Entomophthora muscae]